MNTVIIGSHGDFKVDTGTGAVQGALPTEYQFIKRVDPSTLGGRGTADILTVGYWYRLAGVDGYEPPEPSFRA
jgi:hypothetical protein